jgi:dTDP-3,4-didehydro-2,6-dideoxy-alpha-D-glucose 3-reductase
MPDPVRIGVLGCSAFAVRRMLPAFEAAADTAVVAVASRDLRKAVPLAQRYGCDAVDGYEALLSRPDVDAVYLPLPAALHAEWVGRAMRAGKHVLAEKPLTTSVSTTKQLLREAEDRGLALEENVLFVHHPQHDFAADLFASGAIGELRSFSATFTVPRLRDDDIRHDEALGGGALLDMGVYPVRAALHLLGGPLELIGSALEGESATVDISGAALLRGPNGVLVHVEFGMDHEYRAEYELRGSGGRILVDRAFTPPADWRPVVRLTRHGRTEDIELDPYDQVVAAIGAFAAAVRKGRCAWLECLEQARLLEDIRWSAATRRRRPHTNGANGHHGRTTAVRDSSPRNSTNS